MWICILRLLLSLKISDLSQQVRVIQTLLSCLSWLIFICFVSLWLQEGFYYPLLWGFGSVVIQATICFRISNIALLSTWLRIEIQVCFIIIRPFTPHQIYNKYSYTDTTTHIHSFFHLLFVSYIHYYLLTYSTENSVKWHECNHAHNLYLIFRKIWQFPPSH